MISVVKAVMISTYSQHIEQEAMSADVIHKEIIRLGSAPHHTTIWINLSNVLTPLIK